MQSTFTSRQQQSIMQFTVDMRALAPPPADLAFSRRVTTVLQRLQKLSGEQYSAVPTQAAASPPPLPPSLRRARPAVIRPPTAVTKLRQTTKKRPNISVVTKTKRKQLSESDDENDE
jgi:hypothetical protein